MLFTLNRYFTTCMSTNYLALNYSFSCTHHGKNLILLLYYSFSCTHHGKNLILLTTRLDFCHDVCTKMNVLVLVLDHFQCTCTCTQVLSQSTHPNPACCLSFMYRTTTWNIAHDICRSRGKSLFQCESPSDAKALQQLHFRTSTEFGNVIFLGLERNNQVGLCLV